MHNGYEDILDRINENPTWYDENGTPRFGEFSPNQVPDIYSDEVVLYHINCQGCGKPFHVAESHSVMDDMRSIGNYICHHMTDAERIEKIKEVSEALKIEARIKAKSLHYGDPPNTGCCSGTTMNCMDIKVIGYWKKSENRMEWERVVEYDNYPLGDYEDRDYVGEDTFGQKQIDMSIKKEENNDN